MRSYDIQKMRIYVNLKFSNWKYLGSIFIYLYLDTGKMNLDATFEMYLYKAFRQGNKYRDTQYLETAKL